MWLCVKDKKLAALSSYLTTEHISTVLQSIWYDLWPRELGVYTLNWCTATILRNRVSGSISGCCGGLGDTSAALQAPLITCCCFIMAAWWLLMQCHLRAQNPQTFSMGLSLHTEISPEALIPRFDVLMVKNLHLWERRVLYLANYIILAWNQFKTNKWLQAIISPICSAFAARVGGQCNEQLFR